MSRSALWEFPARGTASTKMWREIQLFTGLARANPSSNLQLEQGIRGAGAENVLPHHDLRVRTPTEAHLVVHGLVHLPLRGPR